MIGDRASTVFQESIQKYDFWSVSGGVAIVIGFFIIAFPKAGIVVGGGIPVNGSVLVGEALTLWGWLCALANLRRPLQFTALLMLMATLLIWTLNVLWYLSLYNLTPFEQARMMFKLLSFTAFGCTFLMLARPQIAFKTAVVLRWGVYFLLTYAILQMLLGAETVAVPNLTAIYGASFEEINDKHNRIHLLDSVKLFGTYQNGNLFSVSLILMSPIAIYLSKNLAVKLAVLFVFNIVIIFSASASAYAGGFIVNILFFAMHIRRLLPLLPAFIVAPPLLAYGYVFHICAGAQCTLISLLNARLIDRDFSENSRWDRVSYWLDRSFSDPFLLFFGDMYGGELYNYELFVASVAQYFGIIVLVLFLIVFFWLMRPAKPAFYKAGLYAYLISSFGEGGFWLTPTPYILAICLGVVAVFDREADRAAERRARGPADVPTRTDGRIRGGAVAFS